MRFPVLWATVAMTALAVPAHADMRAEYGGERGVPALIVEVTERGDARVTPPNGFGYFLVVGDREYWIEPGPGGPTAIAADARSELAARERRESEALETALEVEIDPETQAAVQEAIDAVLAEMTAEPERPDTPGPARNAEVKESPVASDEPELAPLRQALIRYFAAAERLSEDYFGPEELTPLNDPSGASRGKTPLAFANLAFKSVSFEPLPPDRFILPAEVVRLEDLPPDDGPADLADLRQPSIIQAAYLDRALWMLDDRGGLLRTAEGGQDSVPVEVPERAIAICRSQQALWLVTRVDEDSPTRLWTRDADAWRERGATTLSAPGTLFGMECSGHHPLLLIGDTLVLDGGERTVPLTPGQFPPFGFTTLLRMEDALYVGINAGEWGGGLRRIDLAAGTVDLIEAPDGDLCGGILNAQCAPVNGLAHDPARPGCLLAAVGLVHLIASGEVVRVCGSSLERVYRKPYTLDPNWTQVDDAGNMGTVPFFDLARVEDHAWAVAADGVYRFGPSGQPVLERFPRFRAPGIDWSHPNIVLIPTDMNGRHSLSGGSILLATR